MIGSLFFLRCSRDVLFKIKKIAAGTYGNKMKRHKK